MMPTVTTLDLLASAEVAQMLGVSRQRVAQLERLHPDFPQPAAVLTVGRIWLREDIARWAKAHGRAVDAEQPRP